MKKRAATTGMTERRCGSRHTNVQTARSERV